jgi:hypothetical protein
MNLWKHIQNFDVQNFIFSIPSGIISFMLSLSIAEFFFGSFLAFMFGMTQIIGYVSYKRFKRKRKRAFYLHKIESDGSYGGLM